MAIARMCVKVGKAGSASAHSDYIARDGKYSSYKKGENITAKESGNMPSCFQNPSEFWKASDKNERANGSVYREFELALPRELSSEKQLELVRSWCEQELKEHPYSFAIHEGIASDGGTQPHAHLMFSERRNDGIERSADKFFKRYNKKFPERGGAKKGFGENDGRGHYHERKERLQALRGRWETAVNQALEKDGKEERIDMRSYEDQGLAEILKPEAKQLPSEWRAPEKKAVILKFRALKNEIKALFSEVKAEIINLAKEREKREEAQKPKISAVGRFFGLFNRGEKKSDPPLAEVIDLAKVKKEMDGLLQKEAHQEQEKKAEISSLASRLMAQDKARIEAEEQRKREQREEELKRQLRERIRREVQEGQARVEAEQKATLEAQKRQQEEKAAAERQARTEALERKVKEPWTEKDTEAFLDREKKLAQYANQWGGYTRKQALREATADLKAKADYHRQRNPDLDKQLRQSVRDIQNEVERSAGRGRYS